MTIFTYRPKGTCSNSMQFTIEQDTIRKLEIKGGCEGNLTGLSRLIQGRNIQDVIERLEGVNCGFRGTSCPDQIAQALKQFQQQTK